MVRLQHLTRFTHAVPSGQREEQIIDFSSRLQLLEQLVVCEAVFKGTAYPDEVAPSHAELKLPRCVAKSSSTLVVVFSCRHQITIPHTPAREEATLRLEMSW